MVHPAIQPELEDAKERARSAGAQEPIQYVGAGAAGIVLSDRNGCWKVGRGGRFSLEDEFEFLSDAFRAGARVVQVLAFHPEENVIERECVQGHPGGWGTRGVRAAYEAIAAVVNPLGWRGPEYKEDSFIVEDETNALVLVDGGNVHRFGPRLADYIEDVIDGKRQRQDSWADLAWHLRMDAQDGLIDPARATELAKRLGARGGFAAFGGLASADDSDVSDSCDLGAHERCSGCGCACHEEPVKVCGCGKTFTQAQWNELPLKGKQEIEADDEGPAETIEMRNCDRCSSTLGISKVGFVLS